jgi:hypothetical protein
MTKLFCIILTLIVCSIPAYAQLGLPQTGVSAPPAIKFFRVAIIPKISFQSEALAIYATKQLTTEFPADFFKFKVIPTFPGSSKSEYRVAFLIKIMFFERDQAESAMNFLKENPQYDNSKYDLTILPDSSY